MEWRLLENLLLVIPSSSTDNLGQAVGLGFDSSPSVFSYTTRYMSKGVVKYEPIFSPNRWKMLTITGKSTTKIWKLGTELPVFLL